jgi:hypothetical protein
MSGSSTPASWTFVCEGERAKSHQAARYPRTGRPRQRIWRNFTPALWRSARAAD